MSETDTGFFWTIIIATIFILVVIVSFFMFLITNNVRLRKLNIELRKQSEENIKAANQIRMLNREILKVQEAERHKISLELHDNVAQDLSVLKLNLSSYLDGNSGGGKNSPEKLASFNELLDRSIISVRNLSYSLRPPELDLFGLVNCVYKFCQDFMKTNDIHVDFYTSGINENELTHDIKINLYRFVQEALNNVKKHAGAGNVIVRLVKSHPNLILRIEDDGKGFEVEDRMEKALQEHHMGLHGMKERIEFIQGRFEIKSIKDKGTKLFVELPIEEITNEE